MGEQKAGTDLITINKELNSEVFLAELMKKDSFRLNMQRQVMFAIQHIEANPYLLNCTTESIKQAVESVALTGLSLNPKLQQAYLIPRKVKGKLVCVLDPSYMGLITKMHDYKIAVDVFANVVYSNDDYEFETMTNTVIKHKTWKELGKVEKGEEYCVYVCVVTPSGYRMYREISIERVNDIMMTTESYKASKRGDKKDHYASIWEGIHREEMIKKTAVKYIWKYLPKNEQMEMMGDVIDRSNFANESTDSVISENGKEFRKSSETKSNIVTENVTNKVKPMTPKESIKTENIEEAMIVKETDYIKEILSEVSMMLLENYEKGEEDRTNPEIMEIKEYLTEQGIDMDGISKYLGSRKKGVKSLDDMLYKESSKNIISALEFYYENVFSK